MIPRKGNLSRTRCAPEELVALTDGYRESTES